MICEDVLYHVSYGIELAIRWTTSATLAVGAAIVLVTRYLMSPHQVEMTRKKQQTKSVGAPVSPAAYSKEDIKTENYDGTKQIISYTVKDTPATGSLENITVTSIIVDNDGDTATTTDQTTVDHTVIVDDLAATPVVVVNKTGTELPATGGIGTTIFYIVGACLVIGAGVVLVTRRRMNVQ